VVWPTPAALAAARTPDTADDQASAQARASRTTFLIDGIFKRLSVMAQLKEYPSAEGQATAVWQYAQGLMEGSLQSDPAMRAAFGAEFKNRLCGGGSTSDAEVITMAEMMRSIPDQVSAETFDCFFSHAKEDVPLWSMMDTWRGSGLDKTPALVKLAASTSDPRTQRRFQSLQEEASQRMALVGHSQ
jgi:hypothetical protein